MEEKVITRKTGQFGKFQVTLPLVIKKSIQAQIDQSGLRGSEYLRISLILGSSKLTQSFNDHQLLKFCNISEVSSGLRAGRHPRNN